jgi:hypothetical protein
MSDEEQDLNLYGKHHTYPTHTIPLTINPYIDDFNAQLQKRGEDAPERYKKQTAQRKV